MQALLITVLLLCVGVPLVVWAWVTLAARALALPEFFDEVHEVQTEDGATIVLGRLHPRGARSSAPPVLLCHGLAMNRRAFALDPKRCFALALAERGRDVWLLELRGAVAKSVPKALKRATFDDYAARDVPKAIEFVCVQTSAERVDWIGFSMGGMLAYAYLGALRGKGIRKLVTIGSPVHFEHHPVARGLAVLPMLLAPLLWLTRTPFRFLSLLVAPLVWPGVPTSLSRGLRGEHYSARVFRALMANGLADVPTGVARQFIRWVRTATFDSEDRALDYRASMREITADTLVIAGSHDRLATPYAVLDATQCITAATVESQVIGKQTGAAKDYDHMDLILGRDALREVFPSVERWIE
jgi:pimeloyl-ACP methyl ester carboxylesterase